ncbi:MAG: DUF6159 family protein [Candidatus Thermoplasmatota archaeon]|jgi:hypothetical protein|nr:DUF6159 family protein [Candidatus Thermoplasmatota archaeon]
MMFLQRLSNSWDIFKTCFKVLGKEKMLVIYPLVSMLAMGVVLMIFFGLFIFAFLAQALSESMSLPVLILTMALIWAMYVAMYFVAIFSNVAIVGCARMRLDGKDPIFSDGFKIAFSRIGPILGWALLAATIGLILQFIRERMGQVGRIIAGLLGMAWNILTYFVVPVIAAENVGPFTAVKRSFQILKKTWGEALVVNFGLGAVSAIFFLVYIVLWIVLLLVSSIFWPLFFVILAIGTLGLIVLWAVFIALKGILMAVLYKYATTGQVGFEFKKSTIQSMFVPKKKTGIFG